MSQPQVVIGRGGGRKRRVVEGGGTTLGEFVGNSSECEGERYYIFEGSVLGDRMVGLC